MLYKELAILWTVVVIMYTVVVVLSSSLKAQLPMEPILMSSLQWEFCGSMQLFSLPLALYSRSKISSKGINNRCLCRMAEVPDQCQSL